MIFKRNIDSIIAAVIGFIIIHFFTRHCGIGVCPDGVAYISTAENFSSTGKFIDFTKNQLVDFPLLYPIFLSLFSLFTGLKPLLYAPILNATLFACLIYLSGFTMQQFIKKSRWYKIAILSCITLSPCLLEVYSMVWSETIFLILLLLFLMLMHQYFKTYSIKILIFAAITAALASVTRYAGITIIGTGGLLLLLDMRPVMRRKVSPIFIYSSISVSLLIINLARNLIVSGTLTGFREKSIRSLFESASEMGSVVFSWLSVSFNKINCAWLIYLTAVGFMALCAYQFYKKRRLETFLDITELFSLVFTVFMLMSASSSRFEEINSRLLSPLFIPLMWIVSNSVIFLWDKFIKRRQIIRTGALLTMFLFFQFGQLNADYETWDGVKDAGIPGYTEDQWRLSATVKYIEKDSLPFKKGYTIYSNAYDAIHFFTGRSGKFLPHKEFKEDIIAFLNDRHCYLVWFDDGANPDLVGLNFIIQQKKMKLVRQFDDGAIYQYDN